MTIDLSGILSSDAVEANVAVANKKSLFQNLANASARLTGLPAKEILASLNAREKLGSTGFGGVTAIPHGKVDGLGHVQGYFVRLATQIDLGTVRGLPVFTGLV